MGTLTQHLRKVQKNKSYSKHGGTNCWLLTHHKNSCCIDSFTFLVGSRPNTDTCSPSLISLPIKNEIFLGQVWVAGEQSYFQLPEVSRLMRLFGSEENVWTNAMGPGFVSRTNIIWLLTWGIFLFRESKESKSAFTARKLLQKIPKRLWWILCCSSQWLAGTEDSEPCSGRTVPGKRHLGSLSAARRSVLCSKGLPSDTNVGNLESVCEKVPTVIEPKSLGK